MSLEDCINKCTKIKSYDEFQVCGLETIRKDESDDYFIYGNYDSDRTKFLRSLMRSYSANNYVCFNSKFSPDNKAYDFDSPLVIEQNDMFVSEEMMTKLFDKLQTSDADNDLYITVDLNSFNREFLLVLSTMLFKLDRPAKIRFLYLSSKNYDLEKWKALTHEKPEILIVSPGVPVFDSTALVFISGYEVNAVKRLIDKFRPHTLILGYNKKGVNDIAHGMNLKTHTDTMQLLMENYKNSPDDSIISLPFDVRNPVGCCKDIYDALTEHCPPDAHVKIAATNTRLSLVGAALFAAQKNSAHNIQLVYPKPIDFDEKTFSTGVTDYYEYIFDSTHLSLKF